MTRSAQALRDRAQPKHGWPMLWAHLSAEDVLTLADAETRRDLLVEDGSDRRFVPPVPQRW